MINKVYLCGNLGEDPRTHSSQTDQPFVTFSLATNTRWKDKKDQWVEQTDWHKVLIFKPSLIDFAQKHLKKGERVLIQGCLQNHAYQRPDGSECRQTNIVLNNGHSSLVALKSFPKNETHEEGVAA